MSGSACGRSSRTRPLSETHGSSLDLVPPAQELREHGGEPLVECGVELLVQEIRVIERVVGEHFLDVGPGPESRCEGIGGLHVAGANRCGKNEDAFFLQDLESGSMRARVSVIVQASSIAMRFSSCPMPQESE